MFTKKQPLIFNCLMGEGAWGVHFAHYFYNLKLYYGNRNFFCIKRLIYEKLSLGFGVPRDRVKNVDNLICGRIFN